MKILIMGLPGSGKTWLAGQLQECIGCAWYNADLIRKITNDWDFSIEGRYRQAMRLGSMAEFENQHGRTVICDFICPTNRTRQLFRPDLTIWMDTVKECKYEDTTQLFEEPILQETDLRIIHRMTKNEVEAITDKIYSRQQGKS